MYASVNGEVWCESLDDALRIIIFTAPTLCVRVFFDVGRCGVRPSVRLTRSCIVSRQLKTYYPVAVIADGALYRVRFWLIFRFSDTALRSLSIGANVYTFPSIQSGWHLPGGTGGHFLVTEFRGMALNFLFCGRCATATPSRPPQWLYLQIPPPCIQSITSPCFIVRHRISRYPGDWPRNLFWPDYAYGHGSHLMAEKMLSIYAGLRPTESNNRWVKIRD